MVAMGRLDSTGHNKPPKLRVEWREKIFHVYYGEVVLRHDEGITEQLSMLHVRRAFSSKVLCEDSS